MRGAAPKGVGLLAYRSKRTGKTLTKKRKGREVGGVSLVQTQLPGMVDELHKYGDAEQSLAEMTETIMTRFTQITEEQTQIINIHTTDAVSSAASSVIDTLCGRVPRQSGQTCDQRLAELRIASQQITNERQNLMTEKRAEEAKKKEAKPKEAKSMREAKPKKEASREEAAAKRKADKEVIAAKLRRPTERRLLQRGRRLAKSS